MFDQAVANVVDDITNWITRPTGYQLRPCFLKSVAVDATKSYSTESGDGRLGGSYKAVPRERRSLARGKKTFLEKPEKVQDWMDYVAAQEARTIAPPEGFRSEHFPKLELKGRGPFEPESRRCAEGAPLCFKPEPPSQATCEELDNKGDPDYATTYLSLCT